jgi:hypothetical protein
MPTNIQEPRKRHPSETDDQWEDVLNVSECMIHMNEIASVSNGNDDKLALVTPEKKKANPYRNKKLLKHPNGYSDSFKRREEKARCLNKKENDMKEEKRFQREMKQFWDDIDENELLCMDVPMPQSEHDSLV